MRDMKETLSGVVISFGESLFVHLAWSFNCFNVGIEWYDEMFRLNFGPLALMVGRYDDE